MAKLPDTGELWVPEPGALKQQALDDYRSLLELNGFDTVESYEGTEVALRFAAVETMLQPVFYNIAVKQDASNELTAVGADLDRIRQAIGLPEVRAAGSVGSVTVTVLGGGTRTFADGMEGKLPNGQFIVVNGTQAQIANGDYVRVRSRDTGTSTNVAEGTKVKWTAPPLNVASEATVAAPGLVGGTNTENDERKRYRISNRRKFRPGGGNWAHANEIAEETSGTVQAAFSYPALGGPSSMKVVLMKAQDTENDDYSREVPSEVVTAVRSAIYGELSATNEYSVQSVVDENVDVALQLGFAETGTVGWVDGPGNRWPIPTGDMVVTEGPGSNAFNVLKTSVTEEPTVGLSVAWWSAATQRFLVGRIIGVLDTGTYWTVGIDVPLVADGDPLPDGTWVSPAAHNIEAYGETWVKQLGRLGPGENTTSTDILNGMHGRGFRRPQNHEGFPYKLNAMQTRDLQLAHPEILDIAYGYQSATAPTVPATVDDPTNVLVLRNFAVYPIA